GRRARPARDHRGRARRSRALRGRARDGAPRPGDRAPARDAQGSLHVPDRAEPWKRGASVSEIFRRELRRLLPYGLGCPLLVLAATAWEKDGPRSLASAWFVACVIVPCLLGVATVAPDTGAGATAFLAR